MGRHVPVNVVYFVTCFPALIAVIYACMDAKGMVFVAFAYAKVIAPPCGVAWRIVTIHAQACSPMHTNANARHLEPESKASVYTCFRVH